MHGEEGLKRWTKFWMTEASQKDPKKVFDEFRKSLRKDISYRAARATLYKFGFVNVKTYDSGKTTYQDLFGDRLSADLGWI